MQKSLTLLYMSLSLSFRSLSSSIIFDNSVNVLHELFILQPHIFSHELYHEMQCILCSILTWSLVIADLIFKLDDLNLTGNSSTTWRRSARMGEWTYVIQSWFPKATFKLQKKISQISRGSFLIFNLLWLSCLEIRNYMVGT